MRLHSMNLWIQNVLVHPIKENFTNWAAAWLQKPPQEKVGAPHILDRRVYFSSAHLTNGSELAAGFPTAASQSWQYILEKKSGNIFCVEFVPRIKRHHTLSWYITLQDRRLPIMQQKLLSISSWAKRQSRNKEHSRRRGKGVKAGTLRNGLL